MRRVFLAALVVLSLGVAHAQPADALSAFQERFRVLLEISEPARNALSAAFERATGVLRATTPEEQRTRGEAFALAASAARTTINTALQQLQSLPRFPDTPSDPSMAELVRNHHAATENGLQAGLNLLERLERIIAARVAGEESAAAEEGVALVDASILLVRQAADQTRLRARLTPQFPWVEPMDNAVAELMDGMASLLELRLASAARQTQIRDAIRGNAGRMRGFLQDADNALRREPADAQIATALRALSPAIRQRMRLAEQGAAELEAGAQATDVAGQRAHLEAARSLYRQIAASQQSAIR